MNFSDLTTLIKNTISGDKFKAAQILPTALLLCVSLRRPGMSAMEATSEFTEYLASIGVPTGKNTDGSDNLVIAAAYGMFKTGMKQQKMNGLVTVAGAPGAISFTGTGGNAGGPVVVKGMNDMPFTLRGTMQ